MTDPAAVILAAIAGYLVGSISFARIVGRVTAPAEDLSRAALAFHVDAAAVVVDGVSATSISIRSGRRWGFLVALLDIGKAAAVTLAARALVGDQAAMLAAATFVVVGHVWPVWHRFRGGFGVSPIIGGLLVVDPLAIPATVLVGVLIGVVVADRLLVYDGWSLLLAPWFLVVRHDPAVALYGATVAAIYWWAMRAEVRDHLARLRARPGTWRERFADIRTGYTGDRGVG